MSDSYPFYPFYVGPWPWVVGQSPATSNVPPSPEPPWARQQPSPLNQTLTQAGNISLTTATTFLVQPLNTPPAPVAITIPDGNQIGQVKTIIIAGNNLGNTETWNLSGTFAGFASLQFDSVGNSVVLMWDGTAWNMIGGNATKMV